MLLGWWFGFAAIGLTIGAIAPLFGIGGGVFFVLIFLFLDYPAKTATATSLGCMLFTTFCGFFSYLYKKTIDWKLWLFFVFFGVAGSISGGFLGSLLGSYKNTLEIIFGVVIDCIGVLNIFLQAHSFRRARKLALLSIAPPNEEAGSALPEGVSPPLVAEEVGSPTPAVAAPVEEDGSLEAPLLGKAPDPTPFATPVEVGCSSLQEPLVGKDSTPLWRRMICCGLWHREVRDRQGHLHAFEARLMPGCLAAVLGGMLASMLGMGGGVFFVPILTLLMRVDPAVATAISTCTMVVSNTATLFIRLPDVNWEISIAVGAGAAFSSLLVPCLVSGRVRNEIFLMLFWVVVMCSATASLIMAII
ncbi:hypothetical protein PAPYR_5757 [Paratrimastix pyriformis]|uniref:Membrane transporter protein n=1 Tax=Paratrimastix pyriformis TaxID=342808 RepID=A0ABQ8UJF5_9EUKA|nr:hypothetical protein PAPYR_5757 [Paratrimastix pyriformis]